MLPNTLIFCIGAAIAASWFLAPLLLVPSSHHLAWALVLALYITVFSCLLIFYGIESASAVILLSIFLTVLGKLLAINFKMVQSASLPKNRRCY